MRALWVVMASLALAGCVSANFDDGAWKCSPQGDCPGDMVCGADNRCHDPGGSASDGGVTDGATADAPLIVDDAGNTIDAVVATPDSAVIDAQAPDAGPAPGWGPAVRVGHDDNANEISNSFPQVAVDGLGNMFVIYYDQGDVWARRFVRATNTWDALFKVSDNTSTGVNARIAVDDAGNAWAAWYGSSAMGRVYARQFTAASGWPGGWGTITTVASSTEGPLYLSEIKTVAGGHAAIAYELWASSTDSRHEGWLRIYDAGSGFGTPARMTTTTTTAQSPDIALAKLGNDLRVVAVWFQSDAGRLNVLANVYTHNLGTHAGAFASPVAIETDATNDALGPKVAIDSTGNAIAVWFHRNAGVQRVAANRYAGGTWGTAMDINTTSTVANEPEIAMNAAGQAMVVWTQFDARYNIYGRRFATTWASPIRISDDTAPASSASVGIDDMGRAIAAWHQNAAATQSVWANEFTVAGGWGTAHLLETENTVVHTSPEVGLNGAGKGGAAWTREETVGPSLRRKATGAIYY